MFDCRDIHLSVLSATPCPHRLTFSFVLLRYTSNFPAMINELREQHSRHRRTAAKKEMLPETAPYIELANPLIIIPYEEMVAASLQRVRSGAPPPLWLGLYNRTQPLACSCPHVQGNASKERKRAAP